MTKIDISWLIKTIREVYLPDILLIYKLYPAISYSSHKIYVNVSDGAKP